MTILAIILGCIVAIQLGFIVSLYRNMVYYRGIAYAEAYPVSPDSDDEYFDDV